MNSVFLTYIVPVFNGEKYFDQTLASIQAQVGPHEVVIIDDGSTDASGEIARFHQAKFRARGVEARLMYQENSGEAAAVNAGIHHAHGKYVCVLSADDLLGSNHLATALKVHGDPLLMIPQIQIINSNGDVIHGATSPDIRRLRELSLRDFLCIPSVGTIVKRIDALKTLRRPYSHISDLDFYLRLLKLQDGWERVTALEAVVCSWRSHQSNMSKQSIHKKRDDYLRFVQTAEDESIFDPQEMSALRSAALLRAQLLSLEDGKVRPSLMFEALRADPRNSLRIMLRMPIPFILAFAGIRVRSRAL